MSVDERYIEKNGAVYIRVDKSKIGHEIENLQLIIRMSQEKIDYYRTKMSGLDDDSDEYYDLQDQINDYEMIVSDSQDRYEDLINMPKS